MILPNMIGPLKREISVVIQTAEAGLHHCRKISEKREELEETTFYLAQVHKLLHKLSKINKTLLRQEEDAQNDCGKSPGFSLRPARRT